MLSDNYDAFTKGVEVRRHPPGRIIETDKAIGLPAQAGGIQWLPKSQVCACRTGGKLRLYIMPWLYRKLLNQSRTSGNGR